MRQKRHQPDRQRQVRDHRGNRDFDRCARVLVREKPGRQHLDEYESRQPGGIGRQCRRGRLRLGRAERAARKQHQQYRCCQHDQCRRRGQRKQERQFDAAILRLDRARHVAEAHLARQRRQDRGADRDADDAKRQLVQPVGIVKIGDRAGREQRGQRRRDQQVELYHPGAEYARSHDAQRLFDARRQARQAQPERHPGSRARNHQPEKLCDAGGGQRPGQRPAVRPAEPRHQQQGGNQEQIEQDRCRRRRRKPVHRVQQPALQRGQRNEQQIREGDAGQVDGQLKLAGLVAEAGSDHAHQPGHEDFARYNKCEQHRE